MSLKHIIKEMQSYIESLDKEAIRAKILFFLFIQLQEHYFSIVKTFKKKDFINTMIISRTFIEGAINILYIATASNQEIVKIDRYNKIRRLRQEHRAKTINDASIQFVSNGIFDINKLSDNPLFEGFLDKKGRVIRNYPNKSIHQKCEYIGKQLKGKTDAILGFALMYYEDLSEITHNSYHGYVLTFGMHRLTKKKYSTRDMKKHIYKYQTGYSSNLFLLLSMLLLQIEKGINFQYGNQEYEKRIKQRINKMKGMDT